MAARNDVDNVAMANRFIEVFNTGDLSVADEICAPDIVFTEAPSTGVVTNGIEELFMSFFLIKLILLSLVTTFSFVDLSNAKINDENIVGVWLFDSKDLSQDLSVNKLKATVKGNPKVVNGKFGKAVSFDGEGDFIEVEANEKLNDGETLSIALWIKGKTQNGWHRLIDKRHGATIGWELQAWNNQPAFGIRIDTNGNVNMTTKVDNSLSGDWHHLVFLMNDGKLICFMDGKKVVDKAYNKAKGFSNQDKLTIGSDRFKGDFDEVAIFNVVLNEKEIKDIMDRGLEKAIDLSKTVDMRGKITCFWGFIRTEN